MFRRAQGTSIVKHEGPREELGLRIQWALLSVLAIDAALLCGMVGALMIGPVSLPLCTFPLVLLLGLGWGAIERWSFRWVFRGSAVVAGMATGAVYANDDVIWNRLFGGIGSGLGVVVDKIMDGVVDAWPIMVVALVVWFFIAWKGRIALANIVLGAAVAVVAGNYGAAGVSEFVGLVWSRARYMLLIFLWPVPVVAAVMVAVALQEVFMPNASVTVQPATVDEWKTLGLMGLGFFFPWLRREPKEAQVASTDVAMADSYAIESKEGGNFAYDLIPFPRVGGAHGLARFFAAVMAKHATISESGSKAKAGQVRKYKGAVAYGYSEQQWRSGFVNADGHLVPSLRQALFDAKLVRKVGMNTVFTDKGKRHAALFVREHLGEGAVHHDFRQYL